MSENQCRFYNGGVCRNKHSYFFDELCAFVVAQYQCLFFEEKRLLEALEKSMEAI